MTGGVNTTHTPDTFLTFPPGYGPAEKSRIFIAGVIFAALISINPGGGRFGLVFVLITALWKIMNSKLSWRVIGTSIVWGAGGLFLGLGCLALVQWIAHGKPLLLYEAVFRFLENRSKEGVPDGRTINGADAVFRYLKASLGPFGEFGFGIIAAAFLTVFVSATRERSRHTWFAWLWIVGALVSTYLVVLPPMLANRPGTGEMGSRYVLPAATGVALIVAAGFSVLRQKKWISVFLFSVMAICAGSAVLMNFAPMRFTHGPEEILVSYRDSDAVLYADKRLAQRLSRAWNREVRPLESIDREGVLFVSQSERSMVARKYGIHDHALPDGFEYGEQLVIDYPEPTAYSRLSHFVRTVKNSILGRPSGEIDYSASWQAFEVVRHER